jgi:DNA-binding GntR family transcriptional regulator
MNSIGPATRRGLADEATDRIRAAILSGEISPGEKVGEAELSRMLTVSRGPVRAGGARRQRVA